MTPGPKLRQHEAMAKSSRLLRCLLVLLPIASFVISPSPASASCVNNRTITVLPSTAAPGDRVTVTGERFSDGCPDVVVNGVPQDPFRPATKIDVELVQGSTVNGLGTVDADANYRFVLRAVIPSKTHLGSATVRAQGATQMLIVRRETALARAGRPLGLLTALGALVIVMGWLLVCASRSSPTR
jgi:hypothetical protein